MRRILHWHAISLAWAIARPVLLGVVCLFLVLGTWSAHRGLGSDLLPEMDEGGFILDYLSPAGTSLTETDRMLRHVERILRATPEVESISRRTGLQMGLAAVTEANRGDFTVKLRPKRSRSIDEIMADVRTQVRAAEPALDVEFIQVLQDMIGDLSNAPEPIQIKLSSENADLLNTIAPRIAENISKLPGVVDVLNGVDNTISGPATSFQVNTAIAARLGFTPDEVSTDASAMIEGAEAATPIIQNGRPYTIRIRFDESHRSSLDAIQNTVMNSATGHTSTLGALAEVKELPPQNEIFRENLVRTVVVTGRLEGSDLGSAIKRVQKSVEDMHLPASIRVQYGGAYEEQQKSFSELLRVLVLALILVFGVLLTEFRQLFRTDCDSHLVGALDFGRGAGPAHYAIDLQCRVVHGPHYGDWHCRQERHPAAGCGAEISQPRHGATRGYARSRTKEATAYRYDSARDGFRHVAASSCAWRRIADAATVGHRGYWRCHRLNRALPYSDPHRLLLPDSQLEST